MQYTFEKESVLIEWVPLAILSGLSFIFLIFAFYSGTWFMIMGSIVASALCATLPVKILLYLRSFEKIKATGNVITAIYKSGPIDFTIPDDLGRVEIGSDNLKIELKKDQRRFVLHSHFLKNKSDFHKLFDQMIKDHPPAANKVILNASVLEIMEHSKKYKR